MKTTKLESIGSSQHQTTQGNSDPKLASKITAYKRRAEARVAEIKRDLNKHIAETTHPFGDYVSVSTALMEMACERYLSTHEDAVEAFDFIQTVFNRVVCKRNGALQ